MKTRIKKFSLFALLAASLTLTACGPIAGHIEGDSKGTSREVVIVGGDKFDCIFQNRNLQHATMDCFNLKMKAKPGEQDTSGFKRGIITSNGEKFDCIHENQSLQHATMSCFRIIKR